MCGIIGYLGTQPAAEIVLGGLKRLEHLGYDSAGLATVADGQLHVRRAVGRLDGLAEALAAEPAPGTLGIGHTRWATHGRPSQENAHPHVDAAGRIALVHNGVIENHAAIRSFLEGQGVRFRSETDTESLAQLIGFFYSQTGDLLGSVRGALREARGTFGIAVACADAADTLIAARRGSPLIIGTGRDELIVASDAAALVGRVSQVTHLEDNEVVLLGPGGLRAVTVDAKPIEKQLEPLEASLEEASLGGYAHHMQKEIFEQPDALRNAMRGRVRPGADRVTLGGLKSFERELPRFRRALLFGCGTSWHAALIGEYLLEELAGISTEVEYASELRYRNPLIQEGTVAIALSQSGETADTIAALREVQSRGAVTLGIVNGVGSTIARETDAGVYLHAGPEIGVASTKAFTAQIAVLAMIALDLGRRRHLSPERTAELIDELAAIPEKVTKALELDGQAKRLAQRLVDRQNWLYLGRGVNFPTALEGALKLKEVSYVHAEGLPAAEMKHGPLAMIDAGMPVIVIAPQDRTYEKVLANIREVKSREGRVIAVASEGDERIAELADEVLFVPRTSPLLAPLVATIPLQLLSYHAALARGHDVDKPRNLAKSVTE
ncbi:MAG: glutamine--fructose-6-phosphate transaminase (isomerizing) [Planctomycetaceae bacterium]|nr:glutamine--fructose-6-phosphate transaminase (isomerizing) [Planctomycetaceae bacterium]